MIVKTTLAISAEHPNLPLDTAATFVGSAATFSITGVPTLPAISVSAVAVSVTNASGAVSTVSAVSGEDGWTATFPASHFAAAGTVKDGVVVAVSGTDENGAARTWTAGVGTIVILSSSPVPAPGDVVYNVRLFGAEPTTPTDGDLWPDGEGGYLLWQDGEAHALGGASITVDDELSETSENPVQNKVVNGAINDVSTVAGSAYATATGLGGVVDGITAKIPASASSSNKLVTESDLSSAVMPFEATSNKVASISAQSTDAQYPSAKCVFDGLAGKADTTSLPYALVTVTPTAGAPFVLAACFPIVYTPSGGSAVTIAETDADDLTIESFSEETMEGPDEGFRVKYNGISIFETTTNGVFDGAYGFATITFNGNAPTEGTTQVLGFTPTAHLIDRASAAVSLTAAATLVMPAVSVDGHARDLVVRLVVGADGLNITWGMTDAGGVAVDYETEDGEFPDLSTAGTYIVRLTEIAAFAEGTGGAADVPAKFLIQCQPLQTAAAGGGV